MILRSQAHMLASYANYQVSIRGTGMYSVLEKNKFWAIMLLVLYTIWNFAAVVSSEGQESYDTYRYFGSVFDVQNPGVTTTAFFLAAGDSRLIIILLTLLVDC